MWMFPAWALLAGIGFAGLAKVTLGSVRFSRIAFALVLLSSTLSVAFGIQSAVRANPAPAILGIESTDSYRTRRLGAYGPAMQAVREIGGAAKVLLLWEPRGLDCLPACVADPWLDRWIVDRRNYGDPQTILAQWQSQGLSHLLLYRDGMEFVRGESGSAYSAEDWSALEDLLARLSRSADFGDGYVLYRLSP